MQILLNIAMLFGLEIYALYMNFYLAEKNAAHLTPFFWTICALVMIFIMFSKWQVLENRSIKKYLPMLLFVLAATIPFIIINSINYFTILLLAIVFAITVVFATNLIKIDQAKNKMFMIGLSTLLITIPFLVLKFSNINIQTLFHITALIFVALALVAGIKPNFFKLKIPENNHLQNQPFITNRFNFFVGIIILSVYFYLMKTYGAGQFARALDHLSEMQMQIVYCFKTGLIMALGILLASSTWTQKFNADTAIIIASVFIVSKVFIYSVGAGIVLLVFVELLAAVGVFIITKIVLGQKNQNQHFDWPLIITWISVLAYNILLLPINNAPQKIFELATIICSMLVIALIIDKILLYKRSQKHVN